MEAEFFQKAKESGFNDEEAKNAFNNNMMSTGFLSQYPAEFAKEHGRRWLVSDFEAGDVVLHDPFAVITPWDLLGQNSAYLLVDSCLNS